MKLEVGSFAHDQTTAKTKKRRKVLSNLLGFSKSSQYIPLMHEITMKKRETMKMKREVNFLSEMINLTVEIFANILFGNDVGSLLEIPHPYETPEGTVSHIPILEYFGKIGQDLINEFYNPLTMILPIVSDYEFIDPYKKNRRNFLVYQNALKKMAENSQDKSSLWSQMKSMNEFTQVEIFWDLQLFLLGGGVTSSHSLVTILYYLKKYPSIKEKFEKELKENGIYKGVDYHKVLTMEKLNELDYLSCIVKEVLRIDPPFIN